MHIVIKRTEISSNKIQFTSSSNLHFILLSFEICESLASIARFWWSSNPHKKEFIGQNGRSFVNQGKGRIGFRMIQVFNLALLAKQL